MMATPPQESTGPENSSTDVEPENSPEDTIPPEQQAPQTDLKEDPETFD